jgi:TatD DNase family protein
MIDSHCHLQKKTYGDELSDVVERAVEAGVQTLVTIGSSDSLDVCQEAIQLAELDDRIWATVGFHPHGADAAGPDEVRAVERLSAHPRVVAVGEIGLDYHYDFSPRDRQQEVFRQFIGVAKRVGKPIVIHNRESDDDCIRILEEERAEDVGGVIHCFTSGWELAKVALDKGFFIGFTGIVSFKNANEVRDVLKKTPLDRIVIETDSPYLAPVPFRGRRNEPAYTAYVADAVATALELPVEEVRALTEANTRRLYRLS